MNKINNQIRREEFEKRRVYKGKTSLCEGYDCAVFNNCLLEINELKKQLEEKDKVISEINKRCNQEISAALIQYERHKRNDTWQYIIAHRRILEILERGKSENNTN